MADQILKTKEKQETATPGEATRPGLYFTPSVDIYENEKALFLVADMPGVDSEDVDINIENNELRIKGKARKDKPGRVLVEEYRIGDFMRTFTISDAIDLGKITATMKDGTLSLVLPKSDAAQPRKIAVKTG